MASIDKDRIALRRKRLDKGYVMQSFIWQNGAYHGELKKDGYVVHQVRLKKTRSEVEQELLGEYSRRQNTRES